MSGATLRADLIAGVTVALVLIPQSMAYAELAGLPPVYGLYSALLPGAIAALWGSSKLLATGPVAIVSLMTASAIAPFADIGSPEYVAMAILMALLVGLAQVALGLLGLGAAVSFLSHPLILGFTNAAALVIALSQLNKLFGISMPRSDHFASDIWMMLQQVGDTHVPSLTMGVLTFAIAWGAKHLFPRLPGMLVAVAVTTFASWAIGFEGQGGTVVGEIPPGLPSISVPQIDLPRVAELFTNAIILALVGFVEAMSIAKVIAAKTNDRFDPNQELIGQGLANIVGSLSQAYPASGSFSRSAVNLSAGAVTGMSSVFAGALVLVTLLFLTPLLYHLPEPVLAALIMMAVIGLINIKAMKSIWGENRQEGVVCIVTFVATLAFAPRLSNGILIGAGLAIVLFVYRLMNAGTD
jgi:SulP family sulfate permease